MAINDVAKKIMVEYNSDAFIETGLFRGGTATIIRSWFPDVKIYEVEINPRYCEYGRNLFQNDPNTEIFLSDSKLFLENNIDMFKKHTNPLFFLDAHWDPKNWPLRDEIKYISKLDSPIVLIDDFKTPGKPYGFDTYDGVECSRAYIEDLIKPMTDYIYFAEECNQDGQGCGVVFLNRKHNDIKDKLRHLGLFGEKL